PKTIYDPTTQHIYDVPANYLAVNPWSVYQPGGNGSAAVIEEARTNYLVNSYGAANTNGMWDGWSPGSGTILNSTPVYSSVKGVYRDTALKIQYTGIPGDASDELWIGQTTSAGSFVAGDSATGSVYVKGSIAGMTFTLSLLAYQDNTYLGYSSTVATITPNWQRLSVTYTTLPVNTNKVRILAVWVRSIDVGDSIDITLDAVQLEKGAFATSYIPTTTTAVTRNADVVTIPATNWTAAHGTLVSISPISYPDSGGLNIYNPGVGSYHGVLSLGRANSTSTRIRAGGDDGNMADGMNYGVSGNGVIVGTWTSTQLTSYFNGTKGTQIGPTDPTTNIGSSAYIGSPGFSSPSHSNAPIQRATIYDTALSDSQIASLNSLINGP
ncbi:MAG: hypothetical protein WBI29_03270, partial [Candidatus Saccharimonadales bacterium]